MSAAYSLRVETCPVCGTEKWAPMMDDVPHACGPCRAEADPEVICSSCFWVTERNVLVRIPGSSDVPCKPCLWAHEAPR